jgi:hypothetical protein
VVQEIKMRFGGDLEDVTERLEVHRKACDLLLDFHTLQAEH